MTAQTLEFRAPNIRSGLINRVEGRLAAIQSDSDFVEAATKWIVADRTFDIASLQTLAMSSSMNVKILYVTNSQLDEASTLPEAELIAEYLRTQFPGLASEFDHLVVAAMNEPPTDPNEKYRSFTNVISLDNE